MKRLFMKQKHRSPTALTIGCWLLLMLALAWRVAALVSPSPYITISDGFALPLTVVGLLFLACGGYVIRHRRDSPAIVFFCYAACSAIHWGGAIGWAGTHANMTLLAIYVITSSIGASTLLHLAVILPPTNRPRRGAIAAAYGATVTGALWVGTAGVVGGPFTIEQLAPLVGAGSLLSAIAAAVFVVRFLLDRCARRPLAGVIYIGLPSAAIGSLGTSGTLVGPADAWGFLFAALPITFAGALVRKPG